MVFLFYIFNNIYNSLHIANLKKKNKLLGTKRPISDVDDSDSDDAPEEMSKSYPPIKNFNDYITRIVAGLVLSTSEKQYTHYDLNKSTYVMDERIVPINIGSEFDMFDLKMDSDDIERLYVRGYNSMAQHMKSDKRIGCEDIELEAPDRTNNGFWSKLCCCLKK